MGGVEAQFISWLQQSLAGASARVSVGIGDDAAVLDVEGVGSLAVATDMLTDGTHFRLSECGAARAGHKALGVNLSDLAAMAASPLAAFVSIAVPRENALTLAQQVIEGMLPLSREHRCPLAGGDTNVWDGPLVINVAVLGTIGPRGALTRAGARPGDWIFVTGACGGSMLGRHLDMTPRVREALHLHERYEVHAAIDVSDGLTLDLSRMAKASGCGAVIELSAVPIHPDAHHLSRQAAKERTPLAHALGDGEDFELILAVPADDARRIVQEQPLDVALTRIGEFVTDAGLWSEDAGRPRMPLAPAGFEH